MHIPSRAMPAASLVISAALLLAACGSAAVPTIPPVASEPVPSGPAATQAVTDPTPVGGSQAPSTRIVALAVQFDPVEVEVPAGEQLTVTFDNQDPGIPHDLVIRDANGSEIANSGIISGPSQAQLGLGPLEPGTYQFICTVHPNMVGTITAQ